MTTKDKAPNRGDLAKQIDEIDKARAQAVLDIFARPELVKAKEDLQALYDESEPTPTIGTGASAKSVNALVRTAMSTFENVPDVGRQLLFSIEQRLNPPAPTPDPAEIERQRLAAAGKAPAN